MKTHLLTRQQMFKAVRARIATMEQGEFEEFCYMLLKAAEPGFESLQSNISAFGKTRTGPCDMYVHHVQSDDYTVVLCTTQRQNTAAKVEHEITHFKSKPRWAQKNIRMLIYCTADNPGDSWVDLPGLCKQQGYRFEPRTLQDLTECAMSCELVLQHFFSDYSPPTAAAVGAAQAERRFLAGRRLRKVRQDLELNEAEFIDQALQYSSEMTYRQIEAEQLDIEAHYLQQVAEFSGAALPWLQFERGQPYSPQRLSTYTYRKDLAEGDDSSWTVQHAYVALEPEQMHAALVLQPYRGKHWRWWIFDGSWDIWNWTWGDERYVPELLEMLCCTNRTYHPDGLLISAAQFSELCSGQTHPARWHAQARPRSYWFDDLFDFHHRYEHLVPQYQHYGDWFLKMQEVLRQHGGEGLSPAAKPTHEASHAPADQM